MKATCMMLVTTLALFFSQQSLAGLFQRTNCPTCAKKVVVASCYNRESCAKAEAQLDCNCSDIGMYYNDCIDRNTYCRVFGNPGKLED